MKNTAGNVAWQLQCYGMSEEKLNEQIESGTKWYSGSRAFLATSMLSDVQELMAMGGEAELEKARQVVNCVKYMLTQYVDKEIKH